MRIEIRRPGGTFVFTDENGYFSITGDMGGASGAVDPTKLYPELKPLNDLHLCDVKTGAPSYSWGNAAYWVKEGKLDTLECHLGCSKELALEYATAFKNVAVNLGVGPKAEEEAQLQYQKVQKKIEAFWLQRVKDLPKVLESIPLDTTKDSEEPYDPDDYDDRILALAQFVEVHPDEVEEGYDEDHYTACGRNYLVCDYDRADELEDAYLDNLLEEIVFASEEVKNIRNYFDEDAWKDDARVDGRGHSLSSYDGCEYEEIVNETVYYIYRQ